MKLLNSLVAGVAVVGSLVAAGEAAAQPLNGPAGHSPSWVSIQPAGSAPQNVLVWTPVRGPDGALPAPGGLLMEGRNIDLWSTRNFGELGRSFNLFNSDSVNRRFPSYSYDGGRTFTRDPGAGTGRRDRAHAWRVAAAEDYRERARLMEGPGAGATVWQAGDSGAVGLNWGRMQDGRMVLLQGDFGELHLDALRLEGSYKGEAHVGLSGVDLEGHLGARATLVGVHAQTGKGSVGGRGLGAAISGEGRAAVLAEAEGDLNLIADGSGVRAKAGFDAFAGAKADGELPIEINILGVKFVLTPNGYVAAGAGINADAYAGLSGKGVKMGCKAGACVGLGGGGGADLEIDVTGVLDFFDSLGSGGGYRPPEDFKPRVLGECGMGMYNVSVVNCIGSRTVQRWPKEQAEKLLEDERAKYDLTTSFFARPDRGANPTRLSDTKLSPADIEMLKKFLAEPGTGSSLRAPGPGAAGIRR